MEQKVIYPKLSYQVVGCLFEVYKDLGPNHREKLYQNALRQEFSKNRIEFQAQLPLRVRYKNSIIGNNYLDFLVDKKIILEIKTGSYFRKKSFEQILDYLKSSKLKLGILAYFTQDGVKFYRVLNNK